MIRGRVVGGTSTINGMPYLRGHPADYDAWGIDGWAWKVDGLHPKPLATDP